MPVVHLNELPPWLPLGIAIPLGLIFGSFINVVIYRLPRDMSVVHPASHCPACGKPIAPWDNVPVLSYLLLGGHARCCNAKMSLRYPVVEALGGLVSWAIVVFIVRTLPGETSVVRAAAIFTANFALCMGLLAAAFIDLEQMILPDEITLGGTALGVLTASLRGLGFVESIAAAAGAFFFIWFVFNYLYRKLRGITGMGMGDAKLLALAGAWFGISGLLFVLFAGSIQGSVGSILFRALGGKLGVPESVKAEIAELKEAAAKGDEEAIELLKNDPLAEEREGMMQAAIPFGPFLILAIYEFLFFKEHIAPILRALLGVS